MLNIDDEKIYFVGFSDGCSENHTHYICTFSEIEANTKEWCDAIKKKNGSNAVMLKLSGKTLRQYYAL